jgi:CRP/FNR family transcriptional regulator
MPKSLAEPSLLSYASTNEVIAMHQCQCKNVCASRVPIFKDLSPQELGRFNDILVTKDYAQGETVYDQGSPARSLCIVNTGSIKIFKTSPDGREQILRILKPGDFFGEAVLFAEQPLTASAQTLSPTKVCQLDKYQAEEIINRNPKLAHKLIRALNLRLIQAEEQIEYLGTRTTLQRVANLLSNLAQEQNTSTITLPLSREGLANLTGMTVENFSRKLTELQQQDLIQLMGRRKIEILDLNRLCDIT